MSSENDHDLKVYRINQISHERSTLIANGAKLMEEIMDFKQRERDVVGYCVNRLHESNPSMRINTACKAIEVKYNILSATGTNFVTKIRYVKDKDIELTGWLEPLIEEDFRSKPSASSTEQERTLQKLEEGIRAVTKLQTVLRNLRDEWDSVKKELNDVLDDCMRRVQQVTAQDESRRRVRRARLVLIRRRII